MHLTIKGVSGLFHFPLFLQMHSQGAYEKWGKCEQKI